MGVSFVSIFIVSYHLVFWVLGAAHSLSWDYLPGVPQGEEAERRCSWKEKPLGSLIVVSRVGIGVLTVFYMRGVATLMVVGR